SGLGNADVHVGDNGTLVVDAQLSGTGTGLLGEYFNVAPPNISNTNPYASSLANLTSFVSPHTPTHTAVSNVDFSNGGNNSSDASNANFPNVFANNGFGSGAPFASVGYATADNIVAVWRGKISLPAGVTRFATRSDDGSAVFIDGQLVVNNNFFQGATTRHGDTPVYAEAGEHDIVVVFYEGSGGAGIQLGYDPGLTGNRQIIPEGVLSPIAGPVVLPNNIEVSGDATVRGNNMNRLTFGALHVQADGSMTVESSHSATISFAGAATIEGGTATLITTTRLGLDGVVSEVNGVANILKQGDAGLTLANQNTYT